MPRASTPQSLSGAPAADGAATGGRPRFPLVDPLRALAALAILGTHAAFFAGAYGGPGLAAQLAARLEVGVSVFFVISGFLLYRPYAAAHLLGVAPPRTGSYALRRLARIVPAYWLALTVIALATPIPGVGLNTGSLRYYLFGQIYDESTIGFGLTQAWSLCVEITFYAFLPVWAAGLRGVAERARTRAGGGSPLRAELLALAALAAFSVAWKVVVLALQEDHARVVVTPWLISLPAHLDEFALGMALAVLSVHRGELQATPGRVWALVAARPGLAWLLAAVAYVVAATGLGIDGRFLAPMSGVQYLALHGLYAVVGLCLFAPAVIGDPRRGPLRRALAVTPLVWLGTVSYGIYLWHDAVLNRLAAWGWGDRVVLHPYLWWPAGALAGGALCAAISWYALEQPLLRRVHRRRPAVPAAAPAVPAPAVAVPAPAGPTSG